MGKSNHLPDLNLCLCQAQFHLETANTYCNRTTLIYPRVSAKFLLVYLLVSYTSRFVISAKFSFFCQRFLYNVVCIVVFVVAV